VIRAHGLRKSYGAVEALKGIDLEVAQGEVFALLGPNGAGKTTTVEILEGHRMRDGGDAEVFGHDPGSGDRELKERIGVVLQTTGIEPYMNVEETLNVFRGYFRHPRSTADLLDAVGLGEYRRTMVRKLSGGLQRRLDVGIGLAGDPELLFLDEPTTGFDPAARRGAWEMIRNLRSLNKTVFLTTHYMDEAETLADRVAIVVDGSIVRTGTPSELTGAASMTVIRFRLEPGVTPPLDVVPGLEQRDDRFTAEVELPTKTLFELTRWATDQGVELRDLSVSRSSLEDVYLDLVSGVDAP
jgi:ABC-2 type transport system ATP-binding protein